MTLILRSDARAQNHLGGAHGYEGPLDYAAMLDFSSGDYFRMVGGVRTDMTLSQVVSVERSTLGVVRRRDGSWGEVAGNAPRISYVPEYGVSGLLVERNLRNHVSSGANGSSVAIAAGSASTFVVLSYSGGAASLVSANLAHVDSYEASGRQVKVYSRSLSAAFEATLNSSGATEVQAVSSASTANGMYPGNFIGYGGEQAVETVSLGANLVSLISGGAFSVVQRVCLNPSGSEDARSATFNAIAVKSSSPHGGAYMTYGARKGLSQPARSATIANGGSAPATARAAINGTWRDRAVFGLTCQGGGDKVGVIAYGQYSKAEGLGNQFGAPSSIHLGGEVGVGQAGVRLGGIITRVAIYNRMLTDTEAWAVANSWR